VTGVLEAQKKYELRYITRFFVNLSNPSWKRCQERKFGRRNQTKYKEIRRKKGRKKDVLVPTIITA
jgi:hypothetical protein